MATLDDVLGRLSNGDRCRFLAFGSSNTEHFLPGMHWFDCLELAVNAAYGRVHTCINTGIGGDTTAGLLDRFEEDAARYQPHLAIVTIGGNDSFPQNGISREMFRKNLREIHRRFAAMNTCVVFQTYYSFDPDGSDSLAPFYEVMEIVRQTARETGAELVDHLARWEPFRKAYPALYKPLMQDCHHLNHRGNAVLGVDLARRFRAGLGASDLEFWSEALRIQTLMDTLTTTAS